MKYASVCSGVEAASLAWMPLGWEAAWFSEIEPFPCKVLKHRFPNVPNIGDMTKIKVENLENGDQKFTGEDGTDVTVPGGIDLLVGGTPCFTAGTLVLTPGGYVPIETLRVGDKVVSHLGNICEITAVGNKTANIGTVKILGRPEITCTEDHPFYTIGMKRDNRRSSETYSKRIPDGDFEFTAVKDAVGRCAGRVLPKPCEYDIPSGIYNASEEDIIELAGWYVGDGYIRRWTGKNKKAVIIALVRDEKIRKFKDRFEGKIHFYSGKDGKIAITNTMLAGWLSENFGEHSDKKKIPYWLYAHPLKNIFVSGYEKTDGGKNGNSGVKITTVSPALAYGIADLYGDASLFFTKRESKYVICGREVSQKDTFTVCKTSKNNRHTTLVNGRYSSIIRSWKDGNGATGTVFNITVAGDHTYIVNGLSVHNCQGFSVAGKRGGGNDLRSALCFTYIRLLETMRPRWFVWENVPGVFSTNGGNDFREFIRRIDEVGYSVAWRVLDAQYVRVDGYPRAVPQRRRRVFVIGRIGADWQYPASVLFEPDSLFRDTPPRRVKGKGFTGNLESRPGMADRTWEYFRKAEFGQFVNSEISGTIQYQGISPDSFVIQQAEKQNIIYATGFNGEAGEKARGIAFEKEVCPTHGAEKPVPDVVCVHGSQDPICNSEHANAVNRNNGLENCVVRMRAGKPGGGKGALVSHEASLTLAAGGNDQTVFSIGNGQAAETSAMLKEASQTLSRNNGGFSYITGITSQNSYRCFENHQKDSRIKEIKDGVLPINANAVNRNNGLENVVVYDARGNGDSETGNTITGDHQSRVTDYTTLILRNAIVRRLMPVECERLMGFPDNWTRIPWRGKPAEDCPDSPRYKACGNSMCVNVMRWIGMRIELAERKKR